MFGSQGRLDIPLPYQSCHCIFETDPKPCFQLHNKWQHDLLSKMSSGTSSQPPGNYAIIAFKDDAKWGVCYQPGSWYKQWGASLTLRIGNVTINLDLDHHYIWYREWGVYHNWHVLQVEYDWKSRLKDILMRKYIYC